MLNKIIDIYISRIKDTDMFASVNGIADIVTEGDRKFPAVYVGKDNLIHITSNDYLTGVIWFQKTSESARRWDPSKRADSQYEERTYGITMYGMIGRDPIGRWGKISECLIPIFRIPNDRQTREQIGVNTVVSLASGIRFDGEDIFRGQFANVDLPKRHDHIFLTVDATVTVGYYTDCLVPDCC